MTSVQGPTPEALAQQADKKGKTKQVVSRDDLIKAIQQMQLPNHQPVQSADAYGQQVYPPPNTPPVQTWGANG